VPVARFLVVAALALMALALLYIAARNGQKLAAVLGIIMLLIAAYLGG